MTSSMWVCANFLGLIEEGDVELQDLDELADAAVGDVELAVEVEGARIAVAAVHGDLAVVDVAGELGGVLVLLVLGLEGADADAVLLGEDDAADLDVVHHFAPVALVEGHEVFEDLAAEGIGIAIHAELAVVVARLVDRVQSGEDVGACFLRDQHERLFVHRALELVRAAGFAGSGRGCADFAVLIEEPGEGVERAIGGARVVLDALLEEARDSGLAGADGAVEEEDALVGAVALCGGAHEVHELHQGHVEAEDGVGALVEGIREEVVADDVLLEGTVVLAAVGHDGVVEALVGVAHHAGVGGADVEVFPEGAAPVLILEAPAIEARLDGGHEVAAGKDG
jgi:hypothetical protein